jgi:hypothetical protein
MDAKSIFASKTLYVNALMLVATYGGYLPAEYAAVTVPIANILLRFLTKGPVSVTGR